MTMPGFHVHMPKPETDTTCAVKTRSRVRCGEDAIAYVTMASVSCGHTEETDMCEQHLTRAAKGELECTLCDLRGVTTKQYPTKAEFF